MKKSYSDLLKDPRWQKKRLGILQRDNFECRSCNDNSKTLHVHHTFYDKNISPWDYNNDDLITLCEDCHEVWGMIEKTLKYSKYGWESVFLVVRLFDELETASINKCYEELKRDGKMIEPTGGDFLHD